MKWSGVSKPSLVWKLGGFTHCHNRVANNQPCADTMVLVHGICILVVIRSSDGQGVLGTQTAQSTTSPPWARVLLSL